MKALLKEILTADVCEVRCRSGRFAMHVRGKLHLDKEGVYSLVIVGQGSGETAAVAFLESDVLRVVKGIIELG